MWDVKKNSILDKCAIPLLRLRTDGIGEKEDWEELSEAEKVEDNGALT